MNSVIGAVAAVKSMFVPLYGVSPFGDAFNLTKGTVISSMFEDASIDAIDYSLSALSLAKENSNLTHLPINLRQLDVLSEDAFSPKLFLPNSYDVWVSNPPYIPEMDKVKMEKNVLEFEPEMALFVSNEDPLVFYKKIATESRKMIC